MSEPIRVSERTSSSLVDASAARQVSQRKSGDFRALLDGRRGGLAPGRAEGTCFGAFGSTEGARVAVLPGTSPAADSRTRSTLDENLEPGTRTRLEVETAGQREPSSEAWDDPLARALAQAGATSGDGLVRTVDALRDAAPLAPLGIPQLVDVQRLLKRIAWGGDRARGVARLEFGSGALSGATLLIEAHHGSLSVVLDLPPGVADDGWGERLAARLRQRGLSVDEVVVQ